LNKFENSPAGAPQTLLQLLSTKHYVNGKYIFFKKNKQLLSVVLFVDKKKAILGRLDSFSLYK